MKVRQKVNKVTKSGKPPTSWLASRERERERERDQEFGEMTSMLIRRSMTEKN